MTDDRKAVPKFSRRRALSLSWKAAAAGIFACIEAEPARAGYGQCSLCACQGFTADYRNNNVCGNCGHNYQAHW
jgi:hypothetical protein